MLRLGGAGEAQAGVKVAAVLIEFRKLALDNIAAQERQIDGGRRIGREAKRSGFASFEAQSPHEACGLLKPLRTVFGIDLRLIAHALR